MAQTFEIMVRALTGTTQADIQKIEAAVKALGSASAASTSGMQSFTTAATKQAESLDGLITKLTQTNC